MVSQLVSQIDKDNVTLSCHIVMSHVQILPLEADIDKKQKSLIIYL